MTSKTFGPITGSRSPIPSSDSEPSFFSGTIARDVASGNIAAPRGMADGLLPASFAQERLWLAAQMFPDTPVYNEPILVQMRAPVDVAVLARCLTEITRRHGAWRTVFTESEGQPMQRILPPRPFLLPVLDLTTLPPEEREAEALRLAAIDARRPFDLREGPLVRALLLRLADDDTRLCVTAHHIIADGVSFFHVFLPELRALHAAFSRGEPSPLPEVALHMADFAAWQRRWLTEDVLAPKLAYWREQLASMTELELPLDHPRPARPTGHGARMKVTLSAELAAKLRDIAHRAGVTLFTTLLAAWKTLLHRHTGQDDIVAGSAAAGRPRPEFEPLLGYFNNTLVLRTQLDGALPFQELLPRVGKVLRGAREHQDVPFERLLAVADAPRNPERSPLYDTAFLLMPPLPPETDPARWSASRIDIGTAKVDLYLELHQRPEGLVGHIEYNTDLFSAATVERWAGHYRTLLEAIARDPSQRLADLPLLTADEERHLAAWQNVDRPATPAGTWEGLEQIFEAHARRAPSAIALEQGEERLTYAEVDARSNQLAHLLRARGVGPEILVGLCFPRSVDAFIAILGVFKAGGAYVPLDPDSPSERLQFILEDAGARLVLTNTKCAAALPPGVSLLRLDADAPAIAVFPREALPPMAGPNHLAYVIYTSGSTGRPKGVLVERRGLGDFARAEASLFGLGVGSRVAQLFPLTFDGSVGDFTLAWSAGATLVLVDEANSLPGPLLARFLREKDINAFETTPSVLAVLPHENLPSLRTLITAGEALPEKIAARWSPGRHLWNLYGPTEATVCCLAGEYLAGEGKPSIGRPLTHATVHVLDERGRPVPAGIPGELWIGGSGVARGYLNRPDLTATAFVEGKVPGARAYRTGDRVKWRPDGTIEYLGRVDRQIKLRGFRIELGEIEATLGHHPAVNMAAVELRKIGGEGRLVAYVNPRDGAPDDLGRELGKYLRARLPEYMVPASFVVLDVMPTNRNGKIDRARLPTPASLAAPLPSAAATNASTSDLEAGVVAIWRHVLNISDVDLDAPFFELGGHSLALARVQTALAAELGADVDVVTLMRLPTVRLLARHLASVPRRARSAEPTEHAAPREAATKAPERATAIAIVGMAIRAPGIRHADDLWEVVASGRETVQRFDPESLIAAGADPRRVRRPEFVPAEGVLDDADHFDAAFFSYSDADAALMDPQQRLFLECAHEALENASWDPARFPGRIGVFGGMGAPLHWLDTIAALREEGRSLDAFRAQTLNGHDFLAARVAFKLGLRGPAVTVQTACSTSLSAVHLARQSLLAGECDMALAGGVSLTSLSEADRGYLCAEGGVYSADGHCRPFDENATGMVPASGVVLVVLKRLADALADGDTIHAVLLASAMNNDGADKLGFTTPSEDGVARVVAQTLELAGVDPASIGFVEAHGTGTRLGDPTEVRALTRAFRHHTDERGVCALGSLKGNLGHLDAAAGGASLVKATLALEHGLIPPLPHLRAPNPLLALSDTPFFLPNEPRPFPRTNGPRRAAVNALGLGGTNVHLILEQAPPVETSPTPRPASLLCLSANTKTALAEARRRLADHLARNTSLDLADVAFSLSVGRARRRFRTTLVCRDTFEASQMLAETPAMAPPPATPSARPVVFLFPGHGVHYAGMAAELYEVEPVFREALDACVDVLRNAAGLDLRPLLLEQLPESDPRLDEMRWAQPLIFSVEYALAKLFLAWGLRPAAMLGHSVGEYVAACLAGVFSLRDALLLVAERGRLMDGTPPGAMVTVFADAAALAPHVGADLVIATHAPNALVLSGPASAIEATRARLEAAGIATTGVRVSRASHSPMMASIREVFRKRVAEVERRPPSIPIVSNATGTYFTPEQATSPEAWANHLTQPVRLTDGLGALLDLADPIYLEVGPGSTMSSFLKAHPRASGHSLGAVTTLPGFRRRDVPASAEVLRALGRTWELGADIDWQAFHAAEKRRRVPLPTYPFEGKRYTRGGATAAKNPATLDERTLEIVHELGAHEVDDEPGLRPALEALCARLVLDFFARRLGSDLGRVFSFEALRERAGILPKFAPMLEMLLGILERGGLARRTAAGDIHLDGAQAGPSAEHLARLQDTYPRFRGLLRFVAHCVGKYDEALTGGCEPVGALYPDGTDALLRACMAECPPRSHDVCLELACRLAHEFIQRRGKRKTRILEVGGGHGTLTWELVSRLQGEGVDVEYHFTDIGRSFLNRAEAEARRRGIPWLRAQPFDLTRPPEEQGLQGGYDLILGLDAVHVVPNLAPVLEHLHHLAAPGGTVLLVEFTRMNPWYELVWSLATGYWDIVAARGSLAMDLGQWEDALTRAGFTRVTSVAGRTRQRGSDDHGVLLAERSLAAAPARLPTAAPLLSNDVAHFSSAAADDAPSPRGPEHARDEAEALVQGIFGRLLGLSHVPPHASFYEMGGDSLLAIQMLSEIRVRTGLEIKAPQFMADPTLDAVARALRSANDAAAPAAPARATDRPSPPLRNHLVPLKPEGTKPPVFLIHPTGGTVDCYEPLAKAMSPDRPVFGIESPGLHDPTARLGDIEAIAARYVEEIRKQAPVGPYFLGGWSFGGVLAIEMARQLQQSGEEVAQVLLLDVFGSQKTGREHRRRHGVATPAPASSQAQQIAVAEHHLDAWHRYEVPALSVPATLFMAEGSPARPTDAVDLPLQPLRTVRVPGDHLTMLAAENIAGLAQQLDAAIESSASGGPDTDEATARAFTERLRDRMLAFDAVSIGQMWADGETCVLVPVGDSVIANADTIRMHYKRGVATLRAASLRAYDERVKLFAGGHAATVTARFDAEMILVHNGKRIFYEGVRATWVLEKHEGRWQLVHVHYSLPVGPAYAMA